MMVAVLLGALTLGACVDDNESQSVTDVRKAKAEQLSALAQKALLEGEAAKIQAESEKAYREAWAKYYEAQAGHEDAMTQEIMQRIEQSKIKFDAELEVLKAEYEKRLQEAKRDAIAAEQDALNKVEVRLQALYLAYSSAASDLAELKQDKVMDEYQLAQLQIGAKAVDEVIVAKEEILKAKVAKTEAEIKAWETYQGLDKSKLEAELENLKQAKYKAWADYDAAYTIYAASKEKADELLRAYNHADGKSTVAAVEAIREFAELTGYGRGIELGYFSTKQEAKDKYDQMVASGELIPRFDDYDNIIRYYNDDPSSEEGWYYLRGYIVINGMNVDPFPWSPVEVLESPRVLVRQYRLSSNYSVAEISQMYAEQTADYIERLGTPATETEEATGAYATLAEREETLKGYKEALADKEKELADLTVELEAAETAKGAAEAELDKANEPVKALNAANAAAQAKIDKAARDKTNAEEDKTAAEAELAAAGTDEAKKKVAQAKIDAAQKAIDAADKIITDETKVIADNNKKIEDLQPAVADAVRKLNQANGEYNRLASLVGGVKVDIITVNNNIKVAEKDVALAQDDIEYYKMYLDNADKIQTAWKAVVDELSGDKLDAYKKEIEALAQNEVIVAYAEACEAAADKYDAYTEADELVTAVSYSINDSDVYDAAAKIRELKGTLAGYHKELAELKNELIEISEFNNTQRVTASYVERQIAWYTAEIEKLDAEIAVQEKVVALAKANLDKALEVATGK